MNSVVEPFGQRVHDFEVLESSVVEQLQRVFLSEVCRMGDAVPAQDEKDVVMIEARDDGLGRGDARRGVADELGIRTREGCHLAGVVWWCCSRAVFFDAIARANNGVVARRKGDFENGALGDGRHGLRGVKEKGEVDFQMSTRFVLSRIQMQVTSRSVSAKRLRMRST